MVTNVDDGTFDFCETLTDAQDALAREMLERASAKWPLRVMQTYWRRPRAPCAFRAFWNGWRGSDEERC